MFQIKDYLAYFSQLYKIELEMEEEADSLLAMIDDPEIVVLLKKLKSDEKRHARIVKEIMKLIS